MFAEGGVFAIVGPQKIGGGRVGRSSDTASGMACRRIDVVELMLLLMGMLLLIVMVCGHPTSQGVLQRCPVNSSIGKRERERYGLLETLAWRSTLVISQWK